MKEKRFINKLLIFIIVLSFILIAIILLGSFNNKKTIDNNIIKINEIISSQDNKLFVSEVINIIDKYGYKEKDIYYEDLKYEVVFDYARQLFSYSNDPNNSNDIWLIRKCYDPNIVDKGQYILKGSSRNFNNIVSNIDVGFNDNDLYITKGDIILFTSGNNITINEDSIITHYGDSDNVYLLKGKYLEKGSTNSVHYDGGELFIKEGYIKNIFLNNNHLSINYYENSIYDNVIKKDVYFDYYESLYAEDHLLNQYLNEYEEDIYDIEECHSRFVLLMKDKAKEMNVDIDIEGCAGYPDIQNASAKDMAKLFLYAYKEGSINRYWGDEEMIYAYSSDYTNTVHYLNSTLFNNLASKNSRLMEEYEVLGGKTGTYEYEILGAIVNIDSNIVISWIRIDREEDEEINRFSLTKELLDIVNNKSKGLDYKELEADLINKGLHSACVMDINENILFSYNELEKSNIASNTKILTYLTAIDYLDDVNDTIEMNYLDFYLNDSCATPNFFVGELISIDNLFYAMMKPSANAAARAIGRYVGNRVLNQEAYLKSLSN